MRSASSTGHRSRRCPVDDEPARVERRPRCFGVMASVTSLGELVKGPTSSDRRLSTVQVPRRLVCALETCAAVAEEAACMARSCP